MSDVGRRRLVGRVAKATREAAAQAIWHGRQMHAMARAAAGLGEEEEEKRHPGESLEEEEES